MTTSHLLKRQLVKFLRKSNSTLFNELIKDQWEKHTEAAASYADFKMSVDEKQAHLTEVITSAKKNVSALTTSIQQLGLEQGTQFTNRLKSLSAIQAEFKDYPALISKLIEFLDDQKTTSKTIDELPPLKPLLSF